MIKGKGKDKAHPTTGHEGPEGEYRCSSTLSVTSALGGGVVKATPRPLYPRERDTVTILLEAGWAPEQVWMGAGKSRPPPGFDPRNVQPVASRYTD